jgi:hypothetical protein
MDCLPPWQAGTAIEGERAMKMRRFPLLVGLLWGAGFGLLEASYFTRANHVFPLGAGHLGLVLLFALVYVLLAWLAGGAFAVLARGRGNACQAAVLLAGPWFLLLILLVTVFRERIDPRPNDLAGVLGTLAVVATLLAGLVLLARAARGRPTVLRGWLLGLGGVLLLGGGVLLATSRPVPPLPQPRELVTAEDVGGVDDTGLRVLLVGLDGGSWKIYDPLLAQGRLPAHASLIARGVTADLKVVMPTYSPPLWTSIACGKSAGRHGIHDHINTELPLGLPVVPLQVKWFHCLTKATSVGFRLWHRLHPFPPLFAQNRDVLCRRLWDILDEYGFPSLVVDWYVTYPAQPLRGIMVSDQLHRHKRDAALMPGLVYPDSLTSLFANLVVMPEELPAARLYGLLDVTGLDAAGREALKKSHPKWFRVIGQEMARDLSAMAISREAFARLPDWRFTGIYYRAMDNVHHLTWHLKDLPGGDLEQHQERRFRTAVDRYYEYSDSLLADALRWADERTVVICMSDHGFEDAVFQHSRAPDGFFIMAGGPVLADPRRGQIHIYDVAPTVLALLGFPVPADMEGKVARDLIDPAFWAQHPIRTITTYETSPRQVLDTEQMRMDPRTIEHLRALGYID